MKAMAQPASSTQTPIKTAAVTLPILQCKCACGGNPGPSGECEERRKKRGGMLQRSALGGGSIFSAPRIVHDALNSSGQPLDAATRAFMEPRFGHDFSKVRVHMDGKAAESAQAVNALAYTVGQSIVFNAGRFSPGSIEGRQLLAHELTHVVQQGSQISNLQTSLQIGLPDDGAEQQADRTAKSIVQGLPVPGISSVPPNVVQQTGGAVAPMLQRRLLVTGGKKDIKEFIGLLEPASGLTLKHDPKTSEVSATASSAKPKSSGLAGTLQGIIGDKNQDAEINLVRSGEDILFGKFPDSVDKIVQEVRIDQILALEKGVPGAGVSTLAHEIVENYEAHALKDYNWSIAFSTAHEKAEKAEDLVAGELIGPGSQRNNFPVDLKSGKRRTIMRIEDRAHYFIVYEVGAKGVVSNARKVPRVSIATHTISDFGKNTSSLPKGAAMTIKAVKNDMKNNPTASVLVEGFASTGNTQDANIKLATKRAEMVKDLVIFLADDLMVANWRKFHVVGSADKARNEVVITVERPDI